MHQIHRLMIVDDHVLFREGLCNLINSQPDYKVIGEAGNIADAIRMADELLPEIILMDFSLPDGAGVDAARGILERRPETKIVFLTIHDDDEFLFQTMRSGAKGYLLKNMPIAKLMASLRALERDEPAISRQMMTRILNEFSRQGSPGESRANELTGVTQRELEVLTAVASGASNEEIAEQMFISVSTVKNHVHNLLDKLHLKNRRELAHLAHQYGIAPKQTP